MKTILRNAVLAVLLLGAVGTASADFRVGVGTDDFYFSVGKYDYYPYGVPYGSRPRVSFYDVMSDYGSWVSASPFGRVWRPYADDRWRPYAYGHWTYTQYGQTWQGYEPWAWVGYHYGNWVFTPQFGWVWIPGYDWHPGRVAWSHGVNEIGWMPAPPVGYDYCGGNLHYHGGYNQFTYNDPDYGYYDDDYYGHNGYNDGYYGSYDSRYRQLYGSQSYTNISVNLWTFINKDHYGYDNYGDYYYDRNRTRDLFTKRAVRVTSAPIQRSQLERIVKRRVQEVPVEVREIQAEGKSVKVVIPKGEEERIRKNAKRVVRDVIAPAYEKDRRNFKSSTETEKAVERIFKQSPAVQRVPSAKVEENNRRVEEPKRVEKQVEKKSYSDFRREVPQPTKQEPKRVEKEVEKKSYSDFRREIPQSAKPEPKRELPSIKESQREQEFRREAPKPSSSERMRVPAPYERVEPVEKRAPQPDIRWKPEERKENNGYNRKPEYDSPQERSYPPQDLKSDRYRQNDNDPQREVIVKEQERRSQPEPEQIQKDDRDSREKQAEVKKEQDKKQKSKKDKDDDRDNKNKKH